MVTPRSVSVASLPYVTPPSVSLPMPGGGALTLTPFGPLVIVGVILGWRLCRIYVRAHGMGSDHRLIEIPLLTGFVVSHLFQADLSAPRPTTSPMRH